MKIVFSALNIMLLLMLSMPAAAFKVCYVNFDVAIAQELDVQDILNGLKKKDDEIRNKENAARTEIEKEIAKISKMSPQMQQTEQAKLSAKINTLQQDFTTQREALEKERLKKQDEVQQRNQLLLDAIAEEEGCDLTLNAMMIAHVSAGVKKNDLTPKLSPRYNQAYKVKPPAKAAPVKGGKK